MNDPNDKAKQVIDLIQQNFQLPEAQRRFWQLFVAYKANPEQISQLKEIFGQFPKKIPEILARQIGMNQKNQAITNKFIKHLGTTYKQAVTNANRQTNSLKT